MAHNLARWTARIGLAERTVTTKTSQAAGLRSGGTDHPLGAPPYPESTEGGRRVSVLKRQEGAPVNLG